MIAANTEKIPDRQQNARPTAAEAVEKFMTASMDPCTGRLTPSPTAVCRNRMIKPEKILSFSPYAYWRLHALYEVALCHNFQARGHSYNYVSRDGLFSNCDRFCEATVGSKAGKCLRSLPVSGQVTAPKLRDSQSVAGEIQISRGRNRSPEFRQGARRLGAARRGLSGLHRRRMGQIVRAHRRSLFVTVNIRRGEKFTAQNVRSVCPADGLRTRHLTEIFVRTASRTLKKELPSSGT